MHLKQHEIQYVSLNAFFKCFIFSVADPDPVGSGLFGVTRIQIQILKTGSADPDSDPDPEKN